MIIGYARVSTKEQSLDIQIEELKSKGCEKVFTDKASGGDTERKGLVEMISYARSGDTVVCCKTDRIARDTIHALNIADTLKEKGVGFKLLDLGDVDLNSTMGRVIYTVISALAQAERERINERTSLGRAKAVEKGVHMGRPQTTDAKQIREYLKEGWGASKIAKHMGIARSTVYRLKDAS